MIAFLQTQIKRLSQPGAKKARALAFLGVGALLLSANAFPALYGDEYASLFDSRHLSGNVHAVGYFSQLRAWSAISESDWFLRLLSALWFAAGLYWLRQWAKAEEIPHSIASFFLWLAVLNPFLWFYGLQIRFYAMFFAASVLFAWRLRALQKTKSKADALWLGASAVLLFTSHLFGWLAAGTIVASAVWENLKNKKLLVAGIALGALLLALPPARAELTALVYRASNPYAPVPQEAARGISLGMVAKIPLTFYFFSLGERVYPLWLQATIPAMLVVGAAFLLGLRSLAELGTAGTLSAFMLLNVPLMYLILDPLAPPALQGAAPRYLIFVLPYFLLPLASGAARWKPLQPALIFVSLVGLYCLAFPVWSYGGGDLIRWQKILRQAIANPAQTCVIADGRANAPVKRYLPQAGKLVYQNDLSECAGFDSIALLSNHFDLDATRYLDSLAEALDAQYQLTANVVFFPAQATVYQKSPRPQNGIVPSRLDLPEQDLIFPAADSRIQGFSRLDARRRSTAVRFPSAKKVWILTNYRVNSPLPNGTPVFRLTFENGAETILRAGMETAAWDGACSLCADVYQWTKRLHLVGNYAYPGAYRQYQAHIWGYAARAESSPAAIEFLPSQGTGYFYGVVPQP